MSVLVVAEHLRGQLRDVTRELITAGRELGPVTVAVIGSDPAALVDAVNVEGVEEIVTVQIPAGEFENDAYQAAVEALIASRRPRVTLLGFTVNSMGYGPAVAVKLGLGFASDVHGVALEGDAVIATRSFYGSKVSAELDFPGADGVSQIVTPQGTIAPPHAADQPTSRPACCATAAARSTLYRSVDHKPRLEPKMMRLPSRLQL
jgi:electron transfer flavoprotein alpha subunit